MNSKSRTFRYAQLFAYLELWEASPESTWQGLLHQIRILWWVTLKERNARDLENKKDNVINLKHQVYILASFWCNLASANILDMEAIVDFYTTTYPV